MVVSLLLAITGALLQSLVRLRIAHRHIVLSTVLRVLIVAAIALCPGMESGVHDSCGAAEVVGPRRLLALREGIAVVPRSRVSLHKTTAALFVHLLKGEILLKRHEPTRYAVVVTAGNVRLINITAVVCVGVHKERTVITVLDGSTEMSVLDGTGRPYGVTALTLQAGDRAELRRVGAALEFRFEPAEGVGSVHDESGNTTRRAAE